MSATTGQERGVELLGSSARVIMHSGNIASWSKLRKRGVLTSTAEVASVHVVEERGSYSVVEERCTNLHC